MKVPGRLYDAEGGRHYLAIYTYFPDIYRAPPPSAKDSLRVAHVDYGYAGFRRGIDVFLLQSRLDWREVDLKPGLRLADMPQIDDKRVDIDQDVSYQLVSGYHNPDGVLRAVRQDIFLFCKNPAKNQKDSLTRIRSWVRTEKFNKPSKNRM